MLNRVFKSAAVLLSAFAFAAVVVPASAQVVGDIQSFYNADNSKALSLFPDYTLGVQDGVVFVFENTSASAITNAHFTIGGSATADAFNVGTIAAHSHVFVVPGISNDNASGHTFFKTTGAVLDESDSGPNDDAVRFQLTGLQNGLLIDSGGFLSGDSAKPAGDGTLARINFLGGPNGEDGPCNDCYDPGIVATLNIQSNAVPEPGPFPLAVGLGAIGSLFVFSLLRTRRRVSQ